MNVDIVEGPGGATAVITASIVGGGITSTEVNVRVELLDQTRNVFLQAENSTTISLGSSEKLVLRFANLSRESHAIRIKMGFSTLKSMQIEIESEMTGD